MKNKKLKVAELFAGVGGFRLGLEKSNYEIVWSNQWEPSTKKQHAWWSIHSILENKKNKPKYLFLENVDRLLKSPSTQRGRDFAVMLQSLNDLDYAVEWRIINAAEYGMPQRRRRVFFIG